MHRLFEKEQVFTIPNLLSLFRIVLLPFIIWTYVVQNYYASILLLIISGLTDVVDGRIARRFNMVSDLGKILDPIADKLTQGTMVICLTFKYSWMIALVILFVIKETLMIVFGALTVKRKDEVNSAKWYGKLCTAVLYVSIGLLILFPNIPQIVAGILALVCAAVIIFSFVMYARFYYYILKKENA